MKRTATMWLSVALAALMLLGIGSGTAAAQGGTPPAASPAASPVAAGPADLTSAVEWLVAQQNDDGGFPGMGGESGPAFTVDAIVALSAAKSRGIDTQPAIDAALDYLASVDVALTYAQSGQGQAAKLVLAAVAAGVDPRDIAGVDALSLLERGPSEETGFYGFGVFDHALAILALAGTGIEVPEAAITALAESQAADGGWAFDGSALSGAGDSNTTALAIQALIAAGQRDSEMVSRGLSYLLGALQDGAAVYQPGGGLPPDAISSAYVLQAVIAVGDDPASDAWGNIGNALGRFQNASGALHFNADDTADNLFATVQAIPAIAGLAYPVLPAGEVGSPVGVGGERGEVAA